MSSAITTAITICVPSTDWSRPQTSGASFAGAVEYRFAVSGAGAVKHSQKRLNMAGTDIDGWPLGPRNGTSG